MITEGFSIYPLYLQQLLLQLTDIALYFEFLFSEVKLLSSGRK